MTINSDRYLMLTGVSFLTLLLWIIGMSMVSIDIDFLGIVIAVTVLLLSLITLFILLYVAELIDPHENDVLNDNVNQAKDFLTVKNIVIAVTVFALSKIYWFISSHINFQTKKHTGMEFLGGKRKRSTHRKNK
jgi:hypothetical protein